MQADEGKKWIKYCYGRQSVLSTRESPPIGQEDEGGGSYTELVKG